MSTPRKVAASKAAPRKAAASKVAPAVSDSERPARVDAATRRVSAWLQQHAPAEQLRPPVTEGDLQALAKALGQPVPADLQAMWRVHDGLPIFEYAGLGAAAARSRRAGLEMLRERGTFAEHEVFEQALPRIAAVKWHTGWIPIAEDGCGNLYCMDLAPGPVGRIGQIIKWDVAGGPFATSSTDLAELLERLATALASGKFKYEVESGTYAGPFIDLLAARRR